MLGYVAGDMAVGDPAVGPYIDAHGHFVVHLAPILGALLVVVAGKMLARRKHARASVAEPVQPPHAEHAA